MKIIVIFGTRPEAIKMAPVVKQLYNSPRFEVCVCVTGQHREMLDQVLKLFNIIPNYDLDIMEPGQSLNEVTAKILISLRPIIKYEQPNLLLVHGDTATTFAASLAAYYEQVDVGHVEAGLRSGDIFSPWPEEVNRRLTSVISKFHFAPTKVAKKNLIDENISAESVFVTGNTVIDALLEVKKSLETDKKLVSKAKKTLPALDTSKKLILVTGHRRENFGIGLSNMCAALSKLAVERNDIEIVYPVHMNPNVKKPVFDQLGQYSNIHLIEPLEYLPFIYLMMKSYIILTDSGGIQEEAPSLGKPVLLMRDTTERPEAVEAGTVRLVGADTKNIYGGIVELLNQKDEVAKMVAALNPYGDGTASSKIIEHIEIEYGI